MWFNTEKNSFTVKATGKKRIIAGQPTREYRAKWTIIHQDKKGRKDTNILNLVYWNTKPSKTMQQAWAVNERATRNYLKKVKKENNLLAKFLPDSVFMALSAFSGDTSKKG